MRTSCDSVRLLLFFFSLGPCQRAGFCHVESPPLVVSLCRDAHLPHDSLTCLCISKGQHRFLQWNLKVATDSRVRRLYGRRSGRKKSRWMGRNTSTFLRLQRRQVPVVCQWTLSTRRCTTHRVGARARGTEVSWKWPLVSRSCAQATYHQPFQLILGFENGCILPQSYHRRLTGPVDLVKVGALLLRPSKAQECSTQSGAESMRRQQHSRIVAEDLPVVGSVLGPLRLYQRFGDHDEYGSTHRESVACYP